MFKVNNYLRCTPLLRRQRLCTVLRGAKNMQNTKTVILLPQPHIDSCYGK